MSVLRRCAGLIEHKDSPPPPPPLPQSTRKYHCHPVRQEVKSLSIHKIRALSKPLHRDTKKKYKGIYFFTRGVGLVIEIRTALYRCGSATVTKDTFPHSRTALSFKKKCFCRKRIHCSSMACTPNPLVEIGTQQF